MKSLLSEISRIQPYCFYGRVVSVQGLLIEVSGIHSLSVGARGTIYSRDNRETGCEIVGFRQERALCMAFGPLEGIGLGCKVVIADHDPAIRPDHHWLGRVINAMGEPIDGKGPLSIGKDNYALRASPPPAHSRQVVGGKLNLGVRAINTFATCCRGQRMGIFAGSGVGKSVLLSMLARNTSSDVNVIGLIGERGREVREFIEENLGEELANLVVYQNAYNASARMIKAADELFKTLLDAV